MNIDSLLPLLCELLAKSVVILFLAILLVRVWRGASAAQRHLVWFAAIVILVLLPMTRLVTPRWTVPLLRETKMSTPTTALPVAFAARFAVPSESTTSAARPLTVKIHPDWRTIVLTIWLGGAILLLGHRLLGIWRLRRLEQRSASLDDAKVQKMALAVLSELKIERPVRLRLSAECRVPVTWGVLRPVLLLPTEALAWSDPRVLAALRHEAGHVCHHDYLVRWLAHFACALYWPNPLIWLAARSLRIAQEQATDDLVLRAGTPPHEYAAQLFDAAHTVQGRGFFVSQAVAMASPSTLETRVIAILDSQRARLPLSPWAAIAGSVLVAFTVALSTAAQLQGEDKAPGANEANLPPQGDRAHANDTKPGTDPQTLPQIETQTTRVTRLERQLALINGLHPEELSGEQLRPLHIDDPKIAMLLSRLQTVVEERKSLVESEHLHTLKSGAEDPVVKALKAQRVAISQELGRLLPLIHDSLSSELRSEKENLDKMGVVAKKAAAIIIPQVEFREATLEESVEWLTKKSRELSPNGQPVNILLDPSPDAVAAKITLSLKNVSLLEAARYVAALANIPLEIQPNALALGSTPPPTTLVTKEWAVLPGMFGTDPSPARDWLTAHGVKFGAGTSALYVSATRRLIMRNTQDEMGRVDELIAAANAAQPQAKSGEARAAAAAVPAPAVENPLLSKAAKIIIPKIELHDATVAEVIDLLRAKATQFDPDKRGVNIVLKHGPDAGVKIAMSLSNIPLIEALRYVAGLSNLELHAEPDAIVLQPSGGPRSEAKPAAAPSAAEVVPIKPAVRNAFKEGDSIEISAITGSSSTFRVGGTYRVQGICRQNTVRNASLYLGNTAEGSADAIQPAAGTSLFIPAPKGSTEEFVFTITLLRPGRLHVTLYDLDNHDPKDNAYAGLDLGEVAP